jgi:hypothetical protein
MGMITPAFTAGDIGAFRNDLNRREALELGVVENADDPAPPGEYFETGDDMAFRFRGDEQVTVDAGPRAYIGNGGPPTRRIRRPQIPDVNLQPVEGIGGRLDNETIPLLADALEAEGAEEIFREAPGFRRLGGEDLDEEVMAHEQEDDNNIDLRGADQHLEFYAPQRGDDPEHIETNRDEQGNITDRRIPGRKWGLVQAQIPEEIQQQARCNLGDQLPIPTHGRPDPNRTGACPQSVSVRAGELWVRRGGRPQQINDADIRVRDANGEVYRPAVTNASATMTADGTITRVIQAADDYGIWNVTYSEGVEGMMRVTGEATIRRVPHQTIIHTDTTTANINLRTDNNGNYIRTYAAANTGTQIIQGEVWGTNAPTAFVWDVPIDNGLRAVYRVGNAIVNPRGVENIFAAQNAEYVERPAKDSPEWKAAEDLAERLLMTLLTDEQRRCYEKDKTFYTQVNGKLFKFTFGTVANVHLIEDGKVAERYCVHPSSWRNPCPTADVMAAQKLMLETNPEQFLKVAVRHGPLPGMMRHARDGGLRYVNFDPPLEFPRDQDAGGVILAD